MKRKEHLILTFMLSLYIFTYIIKLNKTLTIILSTLTALFSTLPDIDIKITNRISKINKKTLYILTPLEYIFKKILKHRGMTHTIYLPIILITISTILNHTKTELINLIIQTLNINLNHALINIANTLIKITIILLRIIALSITLHILEDSLTISGVKILYPINNFRLRLSNLKTESGIDQIIIDIIGIIGIIIYSIKI